MTARGAYPGTLRDRHRGGTSADGVSRRPLRGTRVVGMNRRQALIGYITFRVGRRLVRRRLSDIRPGGRRDTQGGQMSKDSSRSLAGVAALLETVRPIVQKAASDPEFHGARQAGLLGRQGGQPAGERQAAVGDRPQARLRPAPPAQGGELGHRPPEGGRRAGRAAQEEAAHPRRDHEDHRSWARRRGRSSWCSGGSAAAATTRSSTPSSEASASGPRPVSRGPEPALSCVGVTKTFARRGRGAAGAGPGGPGRGLLRPARPQRRRQDHAHPQHRRPHPPDAPAPSRSSASPPRAPRPAPRARPSATPPRTSPSTASSRCASC